MFGLIGDGEYIRGNLKDYHRKYTIDTKILFSFIQDSQPKEWQKLIRKYRNLNVELNFLKRLNGELNKYGMAHILKEGVVDTPAKFELCYFYPSSEMNKTSMENYKKNVLSITVKGKSIIFINGLPIASLIVKDNSKGESARDARQEYKSDDLIFESNNRYLVHFAVDNEKVYMTTKLSGKETIFYPFSRDGLREVLKKDTLLDIIHSFIYKENIFPRYHQLNTVRNIIGNIKERKVMGKNYLINHSVGSSEEDTVLWLTHNLQNLYEDNRTIFSIIVIVTDKRGLIRRLEETATEFDYTEDILLRAENDQVHIREIIKLRKRIIVLTPQKLLYILSKLRVSYSRRFAVIVDEVSVYEKNLLEHALQSTPSNVSLFVFSQNPSKEIIGSSDFIYSYCMRQAIEEGFALDVAKNYVDYETYFKINKMAEKDLGQYVSTNKYLKCEKGNHLSIREKAEIIAWHIKNITLKKILGKSKVIIITRYHLDATKYYYEFEKLNLDQEIIIAFMDKKDFNNDELYKQRPDYSGKLLRIEYLENIVRDRDSLFHSVFSDIKLSSSIAQEGKYFSLISEAYFGKVDAFLLDFANPVEKSMIKDPAKLYALKHSLDREYIYTVEEVDNFARLFFASGDFDVDLLEKALHRYKYKENKEIILATLIEFIEHYLFITSLIKINDIELEKFFPYARVLVEKISLSNGHSSNIYPDYEVMLKYHRLQKIFENSFNYKWSELLEKQNKSPLKVLVQEINSKFCTSFPHENGIINQIVSDMLADEALNKHAQNNSKEHFKFPFNDIFISLVVDYMDDNQEFCAMVLDNEQFSSALKSLLVDYVYKNLRSRD